MDDLLKALPYLGSAGSVIVIVALIYKSAIADWVKSQSVGTQIKDKLEVHLKDEEAFWANQEGRMTELERRLSAQEVASVEYRVTIAKNHEETMRAFGEMAIRLGEMNQAIIRTHERIDDTLRAK